MTGSRRLIGSYLSPEISAMPKSVVELAQGNSYTRTSEGGSGGVDSAQRQFKVILNAPNETWTVEEAVGIAIGDPYHPENQIPCVSYETRPDGDSRTVRIVTFRYRSTPGGVDGSGSGGGGGEDGGGGGGGGIGSDPKLKSPEVRPALYTMSSSLQEVPAVGGAYLSPGGYVAESAFKNPAGDLLEGLTRLEPVVTLQITQYSFSDQSGLLQYTGAINSDTFAFSGHAVPVHCCMFQSLSATPYVESGFRGFQLDFQFSFRWNYCPGVEDNGNDPLGWDQPIVMSGYNIINSGLGSPGVEQEHLLYKLNQDEAFLKTPLELGLPNQKVRAQIPAQADPDGRPRQHSAASPVLLNIDGTPRSRSLPPLVYRYQTQPAIVFGNNFSNFGINSFY